MYRRKLIKTREKVIISILLIALILLITELVSSDEKKAAEEIDTNIENSFDMLSFSSEPVAAFSDSPLSESIVERENEQKESVREEEFAKQSKADLQEKVIYLTFDDGPSHVSNQLLDILDKYDMKATFFMMGPKMKENPQVVKRKQKEGHGLALHGMTHDVGQIYSNHFAPSEEMQEGREILENITGVRSNIIRLPYGSIPYLTESMRYVLDENNFHVWDWNVDSLDWEFNNKRYVSHTIQKIKEVEEKGETPVVLLHDKQETVQHLPKLLSYIKKQDYQTKILTNDMTPLTFSCNGRCYTIN